LNVSEIQQIGKSILVSPNLGRPAILQMDNKIKKKDFQLSLLFISDISDLEIFRRSTINSVFIIPLFDYKWSYKLIFVKEKQGFFSKWKQKRTKKKRRKLIEEKFKISTGKDLDFEQLKRLKARLYRGNKISLKVKNIGKTEGKSILNSLNINELNFQDFLLKNKVYGGLTNFYNVIIEFTPSKEVLKFLKERNFVMFDIKYLYDQINYHSIVITKQKWKDFTFVHATDLHLAERNDRIYGVIKKWTESSITKSVEDFFDVVKKKLKIKKTDENLEETISGIKIPLRKRYINPNNQFRKFIKIMNRKVMSNELDLIILTGDLVDYTILSKLTKKLGKLNEFRYDDSNWKTLKNIILNIPQKEKNKGVIRGEELNCPIFTTLGNHDYRPFPYDLTWAEMYKKIGLNASEAIALNELFSASPITALTRSSLALKGYSSEICPSFDFSIRLGNNLFIILNTGGDSFRNIKDLITGHPSVTGVTHKQIRYLENLINNQIGKDMNTFLFLHGPPINAEGTKIKINIFEKKGSRIVRKKLSEFKESVIKKIGKPLSDARIDGVFNVKYGCISSNWERLISFCKNYTILTLSGHTHSNQEFRLEDTEIKSTVYDAPPFRLKKIENPAAIYHDDYSDMEMSIKEIQQNKPFVVQTPALGLGSYRNIKTAGAYREVIMRNGNLVSFKIRYINR
jgi:Icc-related predicted phosphoesterase